jgi:hypothetical protein
MKNFTSNSETILLDRQLPETPRRVARTLPANMVRAEQIDYLEPFLNLILVLCLLGSLAVCVHQWAAPLNPFDGMPEVRSVAIGHSPLPSADALANVLSSVGRNLP